MSMQRTFSMVKPDGVERKLIGEVIRRYEANGLRIAALKMVHLKAEDTREFYSVHRGKPFYDQLVEFISSGPVVGMIVEGEEAVGRVREIMGATNWQNALPGTIRADFAREITKNIVHGSDAPETAAQEIQFFFGRN